MSIVPSRNNATRPKEKQARMPGQDRPEKKLYTKLAKVPEGARLHQWIFMRMVYYKDINGAKITMGAWRCAVCDWSEEAPWPTTPDAHEPFCPAPKLGMID